MYIWRSAISNLCIAVIFAGVFYLHWWPILVVLGVYYLLQLCDKVIDAIESLAR
jgi:hypothetical protein